MPTYKECLNVGRRVPLTDTDDIANHSITLPKLGRDVLDTFASREIIMTLVKSYNGENAQAIYNAFDSLYDKINDKMDEVHCSCKTGDDLLSDRIVNLKKSVEKIINKLYEDSDDDVSEIITSYIDAVVYQRTNELYVKILELQNQIAKKQDKLVAGSNITIAGNLISATCSGGSSTESVTTYGQWVETEINKSLVLSLVYDSNLDGAGGSIGVIVKKNYTLHREREVYINGVYTNKEQIDTPYTNKPISGDVSVTTNITGVGYQGALTNDTFYVSIGENTSNAERQINITVLAEGLTATTQVTQDVKDTPLGVFVIYNKDTKRLSLAYEEDGYNGAIVKVTYPSNDTDVLLGFANVGDAGITLTDIADITSINGLSSFGAQPLVSPEGTTISIKRYTTSGKELVVWKDKNVGYSAEDFEGGSDTPDTPGGDEPDEPGGDDEEETIPAIYGTINFEEMPENVANAIKAEVEEDDTAFTKINSVAVHNAVTHANVYETTMSGSENACAFFLLPNIAAYTGKQMKHCAGTFGDETLTNAGGSAHVDGDVVTIGGKEYKCYAFVENAGMFDIDFNFGLI